MTRGQVVVSKCGRDKGRFLVVLDVFDTYLFLADGKLRTLKSPKKKKIKHVQQTNHILDLLKPCCGRALQDADIRKQLKKFNFPEGGS
jgi:ribosomal protein L14E/L6E/L27E